jgi:catechol 2,3-dioxygenase-like lactoylglutathione lyase family enzyme
MVFVFGSELGAHGSLAHFEIKSELLPSAESQHFALRTQQVENMKRFYTEDLGFTLSDVVQDETGQLKACFVRGNEMHHTLALFGAPVSCFDHQSFETPSWDELKDWADHMGKLRVEIVWGVGRHGPGNDVFFMVRDPDGNLAEISSEIEICPDSRPVGQWKHEERTLNLWGKAIMRS